MIEERIDMREVEQYLHQIVARGQKPPMKRLATIMHRSVLRNFQEGGRPDKWRPLSRNTQAAGRKAGRPLQDRGILKKSVHQKVLGLDNASVYTHHQLAPYHQCGTGLAGPKKARYRIEAKNKKTLRFKVAGAGQGRDKKGRFTAQAKMVFPQFVMHPGVPARPFMLWQREDVHACQTTLIDYLVKGR